MFSLNNYDRDVHIYIFGLSVNEPENLISVKNAWNRLHKFVMISTKSVFDTQTMFGNESQEWK